MAGASHGRAVAVALTLAIGLGLLGALGSRSRGAGDSDAVETRSSSSDVAAPPPASLAGRRGAAKTEPGGAPVPPGGSLLRIVSVETGKPIPDVLWRFVGPYGSSIRSEGRTAADGTAVLSAADVAYWEHERIHLWGDGLRDDSTYRPAGAVDGVAEVKMGRLLVDFSGVVTDGAGHPLEGICVLTSYGSFVESNTDPPDAFRRTKTAADGRFSVAGKVWYPDADFDMEWLSLWVGGPGWRPKAIRLDRKGQKDLEVRLDRDVDGGTLDLSVVQPDGSPAPGADVWLGAARPADDAQERFAEVWREKDDPRDPGYATWTRVGDRDLWHQVVGADGRRIVHPLPPGPLRIQAKSAAGAVDVTVEARRGPAVTQAVVRLEPWRAVTGRVRVARDVGWACTHEAHVHTAEIDGWPAFGRDEPVLPGDGFRFDVPRTARLLRVHTRWHPDVEVSLPPAPAVDVAPLDVHEVVVPSARAVEGTLRWPAGVKAEPWSQVRVEDDAVVVASTTTYWTGDGGPLFTLVLPHRPDPKSRVVVRLRAGDGGRSPEMRFDGPFDFYRGRIDLVVPADR